MPERPPTTELARREAARQKALATESLVKRLRDALVSEDYEDVRWTELTDEADAWLAS